MLNNILCFAHTVVQLRCSFLCSCAQTSIEGPSTWFSPGRPPPYRRDRPRHSRSHWVNPSDSMRSQGRSHRRTSTTVPVRTDASVHAATSRRSALGGLASRRWRRGRVEVTEISSSGRRFTWPPPKGSWACAGEKQGLRPVSLKGRHRGS